MNYAWWLHMALATVFFVSEVWYHGEQTGYRRGRDAK